MQEWSRSIGQAGIINMLVGRKVSTTVWRNRVLAAAGMEQHQHVVEVLLDVSKFFENVRYHKLVELGRKMGYPLRRLLQSGHICGAAQAAPGRQRLHRRH